MKHYLPSTCSSAWLPGIQIIPATSLMTGLIMCLCPTGFPSLCVSGRYFEQNDLADQPE